jgi:hypothetical protein
VLERHDTTDLGPSELRVSTVFALSDTDTMSSHSDTPPDDYFNDMSRDVPHKRRRSNDGGISPVDNASGEADGGPPKAKRIACVICRKRKLKCDGAKPSCSTCTRLNHNCAYDEVRRKSGPKRGYVKALEERLSEYSYLPNLRRTFRRQYYSSISDSPLTSVALYKPKSLVQLNHLMEKGS